MKIKKLLALGIYFGICVGLPLGLIIAVFVISGGRMVLFIAGVLTVIALLGAAVAWAKLTLEG